MSAPRSERSLPAFSLRRPVTVTMVFVAILVVGLIAIKRIPLEFLPDISGPVLWVQIPHLNSTPQEIEQRIAIPSEGEMRTVKNVKKVESFINSSYENLRIEFDWNTDMDYAYLEVTERLDRLLPSFPDDVERYLVWRFTASDLEIMWMDVGWEGATQDDLWRMIDQKLRPRLERIDGVAQVEVWGAKATRINVDLDQARLRKYGMSGVELIRGIEDSHVNLVSGNLSADGTRYVVRAIHRYEDIEQLRDLIINRQGLRLKDVADVYYGPPPREMITRVDGRETLAIGVKKESRANTIQVCRAVREVTEAMTQEETYPGLHFTIGFDQSEYILESFQNLASSGRWGALLAIVILFLFLRDLRSTLMIALAIPISVVMAIAVLYFFGKTLNVLSMMGLMLAVGMVVDNAIVVVENI
ncbi:MAG: efflux RND transporter permease subunit, partial [Myxococcales bacterium]|nr:efflux RND transporter permease subunit [Myxococcales bacterium]